MELSIGVSFALVSCVYLLVFTSPATAKCRGQWAIHACFGGNGKRSDPNMSPETNIEPSLLRRVLFSDAQNLNRITQNDNSALNEDVMSPAENEIDGLKNTDDESNRMQLTRNAPEVRDLRRYLRALVIQHALRENEGYLI
uniref:Uncharacterized protein n=1 Tax=Arion vulgaris TaxID=1028688 RepID=A0A0B6ZT42_9EUPU